VALVVLAMVVALATIAVRRIRRQAP
jgi:hypothetical protein